MKDDEVDNEKVAVVAFQNITIIERLNYSVKV